MRKSQAIASSAKVALALFFCGQGAALNAQSFHFEDGNLSGWLTGGTAFSRQPTFGNNIEARRAGETPGHEGDYWIGTFEARPNSAAPVGTAQGDEPIGAALSPVFTIRDNSLTLLVGGGSEAEGQRVELLVEPGVGDRGGGTRTGVGSRAQVPEGSFIVHATASGQNSETMRRVAWDTRTVIGRRARILITDDSSGPWGHINVDDIRPSNLVVAAPASRPPVASPVGGGDAVVLPNSPASPFVPGPGTGASARFRLTAMGFAVERQTYDTINEADGRGDEVFVRGDVFMADAAGTLRRQSSVRTTMIGQNGRFGGGSGQPGGLDASNSGGLVTGDTYPLSSPWLEPSRARRADDLPMTIWEGELVQGENGVIIVPTIWEWDGDSATNEERRWNDGLHRALSSQSAIIASTVRGAAAVVPMIANNFTSIFITNDGNRPIGSSRRWTNYGGVIAHTIPMQLDAIVLTYERANETVGRRTSYTLPAREGSEASLVSHHLPAGTIAFPVVDEQDMLGQYTLFLKLERLP